MRKATATNPAVSADQTTSTPAEKVALLPQRSNGRERVVQIMEAAAEVIYERGFEAATMKEIAERSDTKIGSLYRFFPTKEILGDALIQRSAEFSEAEWKSVIAKAPTVTTNQLADLLLNSYVRSRNHNKVMPTLLESGANWSERRFELRARNLEGIAEALRAHAPHLKRSAARSIGVIMLYNMRTMNALTFDPTAPNAPGAVNELKASARLYLASRLKPDA